MAPSNNSHENLIQCQSFRIGKFLYYARAVDGTMLHALNELASATHKGTQKTAIAMNHFLTIVPLTPILSSFIELPK